MKKTIQKRSTMREVAVAAGVTIGTVSHVINGTAPISKKTTKRVLKVIEELDYEPNPMARYMRSKKSRMIGLMIPNLGNNFHSQIASTLVNKANEAGYTVLIIGYNYSLQREMHEMQNLAQRNVDTIVIVNGYDDEEYITKLVNQGINVILADRRTDLENIPYVQFDNAPVMHEAVKMLKEKGYKRIGFISEPLKLINIDDRYKAYKAALKECGYKFNENHVYISKRLRLDNMRNGYNYTKELLEKHTKEELPDVFIASSDLLAIGVLRAIQEKGYKVPGDFAIIGYDNLEVASYMQPRLTSVHQDQVLLGETIWEMIERGVKGEEILNITLQQKLINRNSC